jgi:hypothetical protein
MPHCDFVERHSTIARATPERIYAAIRTADVSRDRIVRTLLALRGMRARTSTLGGFLRQGFVILAEDPPNEIVLGVQGPFWKPACRLDAIDADTFRTGVPSGIARAAWNFCVESNGTLTTETRILCADDARTKFRLYWVVIRPFSGWIRRRMLRAIRREAEASA